MDNINLFTINIIDLYRIYDKAYDKRDFNLVMDIYHEVKRRGYLFGFTHLPSEFEK